MFVFADVLLREISSLMRSYIIIYIYKCIHHWEILWGQIIEEVFKFEYVIKLRCQSFVFVCLLQKKREQKHNLWMIFEKLNKQNKFARFKKKKKN